MDPLEQFKTPPGHRILENCRGGKIRYGWYAWGAAAKILSIVDALSNILLGAGIMAYQLLLLSCHFCRDWFKRQEFGKQRKNG